jgi:hypothetical protein
MNSAAGGETGYSQRTMNTLVRFGFGENLVFGFAIYFPVVHLRSRIGRGRDVEGSDI